MLLRLYVLMLLLLGSLVSCAPTDAGQATPRDSLRVKSMAAPLTINSGSGTTDPRLGDTSKLKLTWTGNGPKDPSNNNEPKTGCLQCGNPTYLCPQSSDSIEKDIEYTVPQGLFVVGASARVHGATVDGTTGWVAVKLNERPLLVPNTGGGDSLGRIVSTTRACIPTGQGKSPTCDGGNTGVTASATQDTVNGIGWIAEPSTGVFNQLILDPEKSSYCISHVELELTVAERHIVPSKTKLDFPIQQVGTPSRTQTFNVTNDGGADLTVTDIAPSPGFELVKPTASDLSKGIVVKPNGQAGATPLVVEVMFQPVTASRIDNGTLTITSNAFNTLQPIVLTGTGVTTATQVSKSSLNFEEIRAKTDKSMDLTVSNAGAGELRLTPTFSGGSASSFSLKNNDGTPLTALQIPKGDSASFKVNFHGPDALEQTVRERLTFNVVSGDSSSNSQFVELEGRVTKPVLATGLTQNTLDFGDRRVGANTDLQVTVNNTGTRDIDINSISIENPTPSPSTFTIVDKPNTAVIKKAGNGELSSLKLTVKFTAPAGPASGTLRLVSNGDPDYSSYPISLVGRGTKPVLEPATGQNKLAFGAQRAGVATRRMVTVRNTGNRDITFTTITAINGPLSPSAFRILNNPEPATLKGNLTEPYELSLEVEFTPPTDREDTVEATINLVSPDSGYPSYPIEVSGNSYTPHIDPVSDVTFDEVVVGAPTPTSKEVSLNNSGSGPVTFREVFISGDAAFSLDPPRRRDEPLTADGRHVTTLNVKFSPMLDSAGAEVSGILQFVSSDPAVGIVKVNLRGVAIKPKLQVDRTPLRFSDQNVGNPTGESQEVILSNEGSGTLHVSATTDNNTPFSVSPASVDVVKGSPQKFTVKFLPQTVGPFSGHLNLSTNDPNNTSVSIPLSGQGLLILAVEPASREINFPSIPLTSQESREVILSNNGSKDITVDAPTFASSSPFSSNFVTNNGGRTSVTLGTTKPTFKFNIVFKPKAPGLVEDVATLNTSAYGGSITLRLSGSGAEPKIKMYVTGDTTETQRELDFGTVNVDGRLLRSVTIKNVGTADLQLNQFNITASSGTTPFSLVQPPSNGTSLTPGTSVDVSVAFQPTVNGTALASFLVRSNATNATDNSPSITLRGTSFSSHIKLSKNELNFNNQKVNESSTTQSFNVINEGKAELRISGFELPPGFVFNPPLSTPLPTPENPWKIPGETVGSPIGVAFSPTKRGEADGLLKVFSNAPNAKTDTKANTLDLKGKGVDGLGVTTPNKQFVFKGTNVLSSISEPFTIQNSGDFPLLLESATLVNPPDPNPFRIVNFETGRVLQETNDYTTFSVEFAPAYNGLQKATLRITTNSATQQYVDVALSGLGLGQEASFPEGSTLSFGKVDVYATATAVLKVKNSGTGVLRISDLSFAAKPDAGTPPGYDPAEIFDVGTKPEGGSFLPVEVTGTVPVAIPLTFKPNKIGVFEAAVTVHSTARDVSATVSGTGIAPLLEIVEFPPPATPVLTFKGVLLDQYSDPQKVTVKNGGLAPLTIRNIEISAQGSDVFTLLPADLSFTLQSGQTWPISIQFKPIAQRTSADVLLTFRTSNEIVVSSKSVRLIGQGVVDPILVEPDLAFGKQLINNPSSRKLRITNATDKAITLIRANVESASGCTQFSPQMTESISIEALKSLDLEVKFTPLNVGALTCTLRLDFGFVDRVPVTLTGEGINAVLSLKTTTLDFGSLRAGVERRVEQLAITNVSSDKVTLAKPEETLSTGERFKIDVLDGRQLEPNVPLYVNVEYQPLGETHSKTTLLLGTDDPPLLRAVEVQLIGRATKQILGVSQSVVDFGSVDVNAAPEPSTITITNASSQAQRVLVNLRQQEDVVFSTDVGASGLDVPAQGSGTFQVTFKPGKAGAAENDLLIKLQDSATADLVLPVKGVGRILSGKGNGVGCSAGGAWGSASVLALLALSGLRSRRRRRE